jgi:hypothetical protein
MARKANPKEQFNWRVEGELLAWVRSESDRLECAMSDILKTSVEFWRDNREILGGDLA